MQEASKLMTVEDVWAEFKKNTEHGDYLPFTCQVDQDAKASQSWVGKTEYKALQWVTSNEKDFHPTVLNPKCRGLIGETRQNLCDMIELIGLVHPSKIREVFKTELAEHWKVIQKPNDDQVKENALIANGLALAMLFWHANRNYATLKSLKMIKDWRAVYTAKQIGVGPWIKTALIAHTIYFNASYPDYREEWLPMPWSNKDLPGIEQIKAELGSMGEEHPLPELWNEPGNYDQLTFEGRIPHHEQLRRIKEAIVYNILDHPEAVRITIYNVHSPRAVPPEGMVSDIEFNDIFFHLDNSNPEPLGSYIDTPRVTPASSPRAVATTTTTHFVTEIDGGDELEALIEVEREKVRAANERMKKLMELAEEKKKKQVEFIQYLQGLGDRVWNMDAVQEKINELKSFKRQRYSIT